jgi:hypothetical protein
MAFKHSITFGGNGKALTDLLLKAAGMDGKRCVKLTCHCERNAVITFEAEFMADDEQIGEAMKTVDVTEITDEFVRREETP